MFTRVFPRWTTRPFPCNSSNRCNAALTAHSELQVSGAGRQSRCGVQPRRLRSGRRCSRLVYHGGAWQLCARCTPRSIHPSSRANWRDLPDVLRTRTRCRRRIAARSIRYLRGVMPVSAFADAHARCIALLMFRDERRCAMHVGGTGVRNAPASLLRLFRHRWELCWWLANVGAVQPSCGSRSSRRGKKRNVSVSVS